MAVEREGLDLPYGLNDVWSMGFVSDALSKGRRIKVLAIIDVPSG